MYTLYPQYLCYEKALSVFDEYASITKDENTMLLNNVNQEMEEIVKSLDLLKSQQDTCTSIGNRSGLRELVTQKNQLRKKLLKVLKRMYYSNLDFSQEMYDKINGFLEENESGCANA